jgi:hypothetical protein
MLQALHEGAAVREHLHQHQEQVQEPTRLRMLSSTGRIVFAATRAPALLVALLMVFAKVAEAMDFQIIKAVDGQRLVMAAGSIVPGDAQKLEAALQSVDRDQWGYKAIALWSPGGLVSEAMDMVRVMDSQRVNTIVLDKTYCASACSQILFVSGFYRMVTDGGMLGMHSCSRHGQASELCNETIARNAVAHGVAHGAVMAFMEYTAPERMLWFSAKDADCWGLTRWPPGFNRGVEPGQVAPCVQRGMGR